MRTFEITSNCGRKMKVSESIIIYNNELYRLISFRGNDVGWHWDPLCFSAILLSKCRDGVKGPFDSTPNDGTYVAIYKKKCKFFVTHPLNKRQ